MSSTNPLASRVETTLRVLLRTSNPAAVDLLLKGLVSSCETVRAGSARVLARRNDRAAHASVIDLWQELAPDARAVLAEGDSRMPLRKSLEGFLLRGSATRARNAAELAVTSGATEALAAIVRLAMNPDYSYAKPMAKNALVLAEQLRQEVELRAAGQGGRGVDPAFARRAAVNALGEALTTFEKHRQLELIDALLLLTPHDETALLRTLRNPLASGYKPLMSALKNSSSLGALGVLAASLKDLSAPEELLQIAAARCDAPALERMFTVVGSPIGARARENVGRIESFAWSSPERWNVLLELGGDQQATAVQLAVASHLKRRLAAELIELLLRKGEEEGRLAACRAIANLPSHLALGPLEIAVDDDSALVAATATKLLRKKSMPGGKTKLVAMLDHEDAKVRSAAQKSLPELSYAKYRDNYKELSEEQRLSAGHLVAKADPHAEETIIRELTAGPVSRRMKGIEMAEQMGMVETLAPFLTVCLTDPDAGFRVEVAKLLGNAQASSEVIRALAKALNDSAPAVQTAAQASLSRFKPNEVAEGLIDVIQKELP